VNSCATSFRRVCQLAATVRFGTTNNSGRDVIDELNGEAVVGAYRLIANLFSYL